MDDLSILLFDERVTALNHFSFRIFATFLVCEIVRGDTFYCAPEGFRDAIFRNNPSVTVAQVDDAVQGLIAAGLIVIDGDWIRVPESLLLAGSPVYAGLN